MALVVLGEQDLASPGTPSCAGMIPLHPDLLAERVLHGVGKAAPDAGRPAARVVRMRSNFSIGFS